MKKITTFAYAVFCAAILISCTSTKNQKDVPSDSYFAEGESEESNGDLIEINKKNEQNKTTKKKKNAFESFFTFGNKDDFVYGDEFSVFTKGTVGGIKQKKADFMIAPEKLTAGFGSTYMAAYYILQFNQDSRQKFINSVNQYFSDFENKRLERKNSSTYKKYGKTDIHIDWGTIKSSTPNNADGVAYLGYEFVKKSPYFTITIYPLHNNHWDVVGDSTSVESMSLKYYFTKSQAMQLCSMLEDEKIASYVTGFSSDEFLTPEKNDEY